MLTATAAILSAMSTAAPISLGHPGLTLISDVRRDCSEVVDMVLSKTNGRLLSVKPYDDGCTVTVLVSRDGERPEKVVVRTTYEDVEKIEGNSN
ncbi:MAG: hypothetical protein KGI75_31920 [Rhizobiaceae bacterium]|nr:hypothetical protein [Rhizobiaceae bacterium]